MNFKIGSQTRIVDVTPAEKEVDANIGPPQNTAAEVQPNSLSLEGKTALRAEVSFSASALQASLLKQLEAKPPNASLTDAQPQSTRDFVPSFSWKFPTVGDGGLASEARLDANLLKTLGKKEANAYFLLPKTLSTGDGNDNVDIRMGSDGRVHVNVNGKEAWSGTTREFQALTINTGGGNDSVNNEVDGAKINTGAGDDVVTNKSYGSVIDVGDGTNKVDSTGSNNEIKAGSGNDTVNLKGSYNKVRTEGGDDRVTVSNQYIEKWNGSYYEGSEKISSDLNDIDTGDGIDYVQNNGSSTTINTGAGDDYVENGGDDSTIKTGDGQDMVYNYGEDAKIDTGADNDYVSNTEGSGTLIQTGEGKDTVLVSENYYKDSEAVQVETGGDGDTVYNTDGSKVIIDGENV